VILTSKKSLISSYFFAYQPLSQRLPALTYIIIIFLRKEIMKPALLYVFWISPQLDHALKCSIWVFFKDKAENRFGYVQGVGFMENFGILKLFPNTKMILMLV
jgi:hypothetical protein